METHTNIATALLKAIKARDVDAWFELEQNWMSKANGERGELDRLIAQGKGTWKDRVRAALIFCLATHAGEAEVAQIRAALEKSLADQKEGGGAVGGTADLLASLDYLTAYRFLNRLQASAPSSTPAPAKAEASTEGWGLFGKIANSVAKEVVSQTAGVLAGVRNLLPTNTDLPLTRVVDGLMGNKEGGEGDKFLYFDPKQAKGKGGGRG